MYPTEENIMKNLITNLKVSASMNKANSGEIVPTWLLNIYQKSGIADIRVASSSITSK